MITLIEVAQDLLKTELKFSRTDGIEWSHSVELVGIKYAQIGEQNYSLFPNVIGYGSSMRHAAEALARNIRGRLVVDRFFQTVKMPDEINPRKYR